MGIKFVIFQENVNMDENFASNFTSNIGANVVTVIGFVIFWFLKNKCKHSNCTCNLKWCKCHFDDECEYSDNSIKENEEGRIYKKTVHEV